MSDTPTNKEKWIISAWSAVAFFIVTNQFTYMFTNLLRYINPSLATIDINGRPTIFGYVLHLLVFFFFVRLMMEFKLPGVKSDKSN
jgi:hypothetical protein